MRDVCYVLYTYVRIVNCASMVDDGFLSNLDVMKMSRRNLSFGLLLRAVAARASCYS